MITGNVLTEIGDVLIIDTQLSILGSYIELISYTDSTIGETGTRYFDKKFRVSQDGLIYTDWYTLTNENIASINGNVVNNVLYIQYRYMRSGTDVTGNLEFVSVNVVGNAVPMVCDSPTIDNSIFKGLGVGNFITMQLCSNLLKKLYKSGIVPQYITRGVPAEDKDYISFWSTIACYMSMFVTFLMKFDSMYMERDLLLEYLKQMNINFTDNETTLEDLQYIASNYLCEIRKRGTKIPFMRRSEILQDETYPQVDGEIIRVLGINENNEFLWTLKPIENVGWKIGKSSPMYKGTQFDKNLIKGFEKSDTVNVANYKTFGIVSSVSNLLVLIYRSLYKTGIGFANFYTEPVVNDSGFVVDSEIDYEVTFSIQFNSLIPNVNSSINFRCHAFDNYNNKYKLKRIDDGTDSDTFINGLKLYKSNTYYFVRGIIYNKNHRSIRTNGKYLNTANGINLKFPSSSVNKIIPYIEVISDQENIVFKIKDLKIRPLRYSHSCGFVNTFNVIEIFADNKNTKLTFSQVYDIIRRDLIPYNTILAFNEKL